MLQGDQGHCISKGSLLHFPEAKTSTHFFKGARTIKAGNEARDKPSNLYDEKETSLPFVTHCARMFLLPR